MQIGTRTTIPVCYQHSNNYTGMLLVLEQLYWHATSAWTTILVCQTTTSAGCTTITASHTPISALNWCKIGTQAQIKPSLLITWQIKWPPYLHNNNSIFKNTYLINYTTYNDTTSQKNTSHLSLTSHPPKNIIQ